MIVSLLIKYNMLDVILSNISYDFNTVCFSKISHKRNYMTLFIVGFCTRESI